MSRYTELNLIFALKSGTPEEIVDVLLFMTRQDDKEPRTIPSHPLFETTLWRYMLCKTEPGSYCDAHLEMSDIDRDLISIRCNCENADGEIEKFLDWITPYIHARHGDFLGYKRAENSEAVTILAYPGFRTTQTVPGEYKGEPI